VLTLFVAIVSMGVLPVLVNKSTEHGRFDWIHPYLRQIWTGTFMFYSWYVLHSNSDHPIFMWLHTNVKPWLAYAIMAFFGALLFCGYYWFAGQVFKPSAQGPALSPASPTPEVVKSAGPPEATIAPKPDLVLKLSVTDPKLPLIVARLANNGDALADKLRYTFQTFNERAVRRLAVQGRFDKSNPLDAAESLPTALVRVDSFSVPDQWVQAGKEFEIGPVNFTPLFMRSLKIGDKLIGTAVITCANCAQSRGCWIFYEVGVGGWYAETADGSEPTLLNIRPKTEKEKQAYVDDPRNYLNTQALLEKKPL
jgi:hypothetical protein